jgi:hypothetical protein
MAYQIVANQDLNQLTTEVKGFLDDGWQLQGGIAVANLPNGALYLQAIVRTEMPQAGVW